VSTTAVVFTFVDNRFPAFRCPFYLSCPILLKTDEKFHELQFFRAGTVGAMLNEDPGQYP
jgi:hypothetical protein